MESVWNQCVFSIEWLNDNYDLYLDESVGIQGIISNYIDATNAFGPHVFTIDENGVDIEVLFWPQDWNSINDILFNYPNIQATVTVYGELTTYDGNLQISGDSIYIIDLVECPEGFFPANGVNCYSQNDLDVLVQFATNSGLSR